MPEVRRLPSQHYDLWCDQKYSAVYEGNMVLPCWLTSCPIDGTWVGVSAVMDNITNY
jgi:hypothetical protein